MPIEFKKIVKPVVPLTEGSLPPVPPAEKKEAAPAVKLAVPQMDELPSATQRTVVEEKPEAAPVSATEPTPTEISNPAPASSSTARLADTLRRLLGRQIRVYMADKEYISGKLEIVEGEWIKICNARSAGSDYYFDEDIVNICSITRVRVSEIIDKKQYVDFMNSNNG